MKPSPQGFRKAVITAILLAIASTVTLANELPSGLRSGPVTALCYCHCAYEKGMKHCTKMCDLPQLLNRWWAISCRKKAALTNESSSPPTTPGSRKTNRKEQARL
jgi:hypothetical protein